MVSVQCWTLVGGSTIWGWLENTVFSASTRSHGWQPRERPAVEGGRVRPGLGGAGDREPPTTPAGGINARCSRVMWIRGGAWIFPGNPEDFCAYMDLRKTLASYSHSMVEARVACGA